MYWTNRCRCRQPQGPELGLRTGIRVKIGTANLTYLHYEHKHTFHHDLRRTENEGFWHTMYIPNWSDETVSSYTGLPELPVIR
jgi:hypothetical protein